METVLNRNDVLAFIANASNDELSFVIEATKRRQKALRYLRASTVCVGSKVKLEGLSPKYLNGLTGEIASVKGQRGNVKLDKSSTSTLRWSGKRFTVPQGVEEYVINGVPLSTCITE